MPSRRLSAPRTPALESRVTRGTLGTRVARGVAVPVAVAVAVGLAGCSGSVEEPDPTVATVTPDRPVIQPGRPGEANATHTGPVTVPAPQDNDADARFMAEMIVHHAQALEMVELSREGLEDEEVRALAGRIETAQRPEVEVMASWLVAHDRPVPREAVDVGVDVTGMGGTVARGIGGTAATGGGAAATGGGAAATGGGGGAGDGGHGHGGHGGHSGMPGMATGAELDELAAATGREADLLFLDLMTRHHEGALEMAGVHGAEGIDERAIELSTGMHAEQAVEIDRMAQIRERLTG